MIIITNPHFSHYRVSRDTKVNTVVQPCLHINNFIIFFRLSQGCRNQGCSWDDRYRNLRFWQQYKQNLFIKRPWNSDCPQRFSDLPTALLHEWPWWQMWEQMIDFFLNPLNLGQFSDNIWDHSLGVFFVMTIYFGQFLGWFSVLTTV